MEEVTKIRDMASARVILERFMAWYDDMNREQCQYERKPSTQELMEFLIGATATEYAVQGKAPTQEHKRQRVTSMEPYKVGKHVVDRAKEITIGTYGGRVILAAPNASNVMIIYMCIIGNRYASPEEVGSYYVNEYNTRIGMGVKRLDGGLLDVLHNAGIDITNVC